MYLQNKYTTCYYNIINKAKSRKNITEYTEIHHIIPKSLGGDNSPENLVRLTAREHFICHLLLPKMLEGKNKRSMSFAIWSMMNLDHSNSRQRYKVNSHLYNLLKKKVSIASSELHKGKVVSNETREKQSKARKGKESPNKNKPMKETQKEKLRELIAKKGKRTLSNNPNAKSTIVNSMTYGSKLEACASLKISKYKLDCILSGIDRSTKGKKQSPEHIAKRIAPLRGRKQSIESCQKMKEGHKSREYIICEYCGISFSKQNYIRWHGNKCRNK